MSDVPSNLIPTRVTQLPTAPVADENSLMMIIYQGNNYKIRVGDLLSVAGVPTSRAVLAGTGMTGGGQLSSDVTLSIATGGVGPTQLADTGVTAGSYGSATNIPVFTVDAQGRVTAATTIPASISGYVPTSRQVIAGAGLSGGGALTSNVTLTANLSSSTPSSGYQSGIVGVSTSMARADHQHPAVDLSDDDQVDNILSVSNGGTSRSLVPNEGAIIWSGADGLYVGPVGVANQVLLSGGIGQYAWADQGTLDVGQADNLNGGSAQRIPYQTAPDTTSFIDAPTVTNTFLKWDGSALVWAALSGSGTVTSVDASGGTTGMTFAGGPITTSGTLTLGGTLAVANGGTGATNNTTARTNLGLGSIATQSASNVAITGGAIDNASIGSTTPAAGAFTSVAMTSGTITTAPSSGNDIVNKTYADSIASGINFHEACNYATTAALGTYTYNNGSGGVGATITKTAPFSTLVIDGHTFVSPTDIGKRVLVKNEPSAGGLNAYNGVYTVTDVGSGSSAWQLTRATDYDTSGSGYNEIDVGDLLLVLSGTANANTSWVQQTPLPIVVGTTGLSFSQFAAPIIYSAGTGLSESPTYTFNIANTGVSSGSYGSASSVPALSVNAQGQITSASNTSIAINGNQITSGSVGAGYGGTGLTSYSAGDLPYASGATTISKLPIGGSTTVLTSSGTAPQWSAQSSLAVGTATNLAGGGANRVPYQTGSGATSFVTAPSVSNTFLKWDGSAFSWDVAGAGSVTSVNVSGGTTGLTTSGGPITSSGTITLAGTLATANGGTGLTSFTNKGIVYASSSSALTTGSALTFDGTNLGIGTSSPAYKLDVNGDINVSTTQAYRLGTATIISYSGGNLNITDLGGGLNVKATGSLGLFTAGTQKATLDTSGNLLIGTASATAKLDIVGATQTTSFPIINGTQTWNNAATTFTALKANVTDTASASASLLMDLQVGAASKFQIAKSGNITNALNTDWTINAGGGGNSGQLILSAGNGYAALALKGGSGNVIVTGTDNVRRAAIGATGLQLISGAYISWSSNSVGPSDTSQDLFLYRDAAANIAQRNGTNAQTFRVYNTYTDASNYERGVFDWGTTANILTIGTQNAGTGSARAIAFSVGGTEYFRINTTGAIGLSGANYGTAGQVMKSNGTSAPTWSNIDGGTF